MFPSFAVILSFYDSVYRVIAQVRMNALNVRVQFLCSYWPFLSQQIQNRSRECVIGRSALEPESDKLFISFFERPLEALRAAS